jgi:hypothetical protein
MSNYVGRGRQFIENFGPQNEAKHVNEDVDVFKMLITQELIKIIVRKKKICAPNSVQNPGKFRFFFQWLYSPSLGPGLIFHFRDLFFTQTVGLLGRVISPSQGLYLYTGQHKHRINAQTQTSMPQ